MQARYREKDAYCTQGDIDAQLLGSDDQYQEYIGFNGG